MAHTKSAKKRIRKSQKQRERNRSIKSQCKTFVTKAERAIKSREIPEAEEAVKHATSILDKAARKRVIHPNNASRRKSRLARKLVTARRGSLT